MARRRGRAVLSALAAVSVILVAGCGRDDFANDPRPPVPAEITVKISDNQVQVSPAEFGAGLTNFTIANLSDETAVLVLNDTSGQLAESQEMPAGGNAVLKADLETGEYEARADGPTGVVPSQFTVGPERGSGQNDLLLP